VAAGLRGARDRFHSARVPGSRNRLRGSFLAANPVLLLLLLPPNETASFLGKGCAGASADPATRARTSGRSTPSWWAAPPLRTTRCLKACELVELPTQSLNPPERIPGFASCHRFTGPGWDSSRELLCGFPLRRQPRSAEYGICDSHTCRIHAPMARREGETNKHHQARTVVDHEPTSIPFSWSWPFC